MKRLSCLRGLLLLLLAAGLRAEDKPAGGSAKSGNWLVDAMADNTAAKPGETNASPTPGEETSRGGNPALVNHAKPAGDNPLASYLKEWMTPGDLELLKANGSSARSAGKAAPSRESLPANPYMNAPAPEVSAAPTAPQSPPAVSLAAPAPTQKNEVSPTKDAGPPAEVRKAQDDAKYFPQLKRF